MTVSFPDWMVLVFAAVLFAGTVADFVSKALDRRLRKLRASNALLRIASMTRKDQDTDDSLLAEMKAVAKAAYEEMAK
jgi:hypothetical protein